MACRNDLKLQHLTYKNALIGRFFISVLLFLLSPLCYADDNFKPICVSTHFDEKAIVDYVIDGDTVVLADKRHIRLIGINTPELSHNKKPSDVGAVIARESLITMLGNQATIHLRYGQEQHDRHGRTLAHLYLANGINVQAQLLKSGLAMPLRIPPNLSIADCYDKASQYAKNKNHGLWALSRYKTHAVASLSGNETGFYFISGNVRRVTKSRSSIWINLNNDVALRITKNDLSYFNETELHSLQGETIEASGWLYKQKGQLRMRLRHSLDLNIVRNQTLN
jgi:endonuclease YncB( thermonuclease family)